MSMQRHLQRRLLYVTAAAAFGSSSLDCHAFSPLVPPTRPRFASTFPSPPSLPYFTTTSTTTTRLYSSKNKSNGNILTRLAKKVLPFLKSDEEKQAAIEKKRVKQEVKGGIQEVLRDAPLPVKMIGNMIAPLFASAASTMAEAMQSQQQVMDDLLQDAQACLVRDSLASQALGEPISVGMPFSQGSSTVMINGVTTTQIQAAFNVQGSKSSGVARMDATGDGISSLILDVDGRRINVNLSSSGGSTVIGGGGSSSSSSFQKTNLGKNPKNTGEIIDVEFVEKDDNDGKK